MPCRLEALVFRFWKLNKDGMSLSVEPAQQAFHGAVAHGGATAGGDIGPLPNMEENAGAGPGLRRRSVVIDKYSEPIFAIGHAHFFRAFPIGRVHGSAVHDDVVIRRVGVINAFQRGGTLNVGQLDFAHGIGSRVTKGELLAKIDTPEVDQELNQTRAARQQIVAQMELARITADRWQNLLKTDSVSAQEADQNTSGYKQAQANLAAADANVRRLEQLEGFKEVYAPFTGVLTRRNVDPGALINAGAQAAGRELFDIARVDPLRVYTSVPQAYAPYIKVGAKTFVALQEFPGQKFVATVARTAEAIDTNTRTLLTEVDVPNKDGRLLPGSFGEVHFAVGSNVNKVTVPVNTMLFRAQGAQVAVIGPNNKVQLRAINIGRDYGTALEILGGVAPTDRIVVNPPDSLVSGTPVHVAAPSK